MLALIWLVVGLLLGRFVVRRSVALGLTAVLWAITVITIAARTVAPVRRQNRQRTGGAESRRGPTRP